MVIFALLFLFGLQSFRLLWHRIFPADNITISLAVDEPCLSFMFFSSQLFHNFNFKRFPLAVYEHMEQEISAQSPLVIGSSEIKRLVIVCVLVTLMSRAGHSEPAEVAACLALTLAVRKYVVEQKVNAVCHHEVPKESEPVIHRFPWSWADLASK